MNEFSRFNPRLLVFGLGGGLLSGLGAGFAVWASTGELVHGVSWLMLCAASMVAYTLLARLTFDRWDELQAGRLRRTVQQLSQGNLDTGAEEDPELHRLSRSLQRALWQVQRVTHGLHRTSGGVGDQAAAVLEAARRQGKAVERSLAAVAAMRQSLLGAGKRVSHLESFARETTAALMDMTESVEQVAGALDGLKDNAERTSDRMEAFTQLTGSVAEAGESLHKLAVATRDTVSLAEGAIDAVRRRSDETGELAREVTHTAERGAVLVNDSLRGLQRIDESVRRAALLVDGLGVSSLEIGRVVDVIQDVADQTNLLALNASIIAQQAGERGRAFGVVANEVRSLAEKTARATRDIAQKVKAVRDGMERAVELVARGRDEAAVGVQLGTRAAEALQAIRRTAQRTLAAVESTQAETGRLEHQGAQLVQAGAQVSERVREVLSLAGKQVAESRDLSRQAQEMARTARDASARAQGQVGVGRELSDSVLRLTAAIDEIKTAQAVLNRSDLSIAEEVEQMRDEAQTVVRIGDGLSRTVEQLTHEAQALDHEVFRFRLPSPRAGGVLKVGVHQRSGLDSAQGLDPLFAIDLQMAEAGCAVFSSLLRSEDGSLVPDLAERWEADAANLRFRFHLRRGVCFSDGQPLTAQHVKAHYERLLDARLGAPDAPLFIDLEGAQAYREGSSAEVRGIQAVDAHCVEFHLQEPRAFFLRLMALPSGGIARREGGRLLGAGPFQVREATHERLVLERNPTYFRPSLPLLNRVEFTHHGSRAACLEAFKRRQVQLVSYLHGENLTRSGIDPVEALTVNTPSVWFLGFHTQTPPFDDVRVRQAVRAGLDVRSLVERFHPGARVAVSLTPPSLLEPGELDAAGPDVARARALLAEAGHSRLTLRLYYPPDRDTRAEDQVLFGPLLEAGLVQLEHVELREGYWERAREGRLPLFRGNWIADVADPDNFLRVLLNSRAQGYYALAFRNAELDRLTDAARVEVDPQSRAQLYRRAEQLAAQEVPLVPLYHERFHLTASPEVLGVRMHATPPQVRFDEIWLAE